MRTRITAAAIALLLATLTACGQSYDDTIAACAQALKDNGGNGKPAACDDVKDDDYGVIVMSVTAEREGWVDENGDVDMGEMLKDGSN